VSVVSRLLLYKKVYEEDEEEDAKVCPDGPMEGQMGGRLAGWLSEQESGSAHATTAFPKASRIN
jgi:hypothetical protein